MLHLFPFHFFLHFQLVHFLFSGTVPPVSGSGMSMSQHRLLEPIFPFLTYSPPSLCFAVYLKPLPGKFDVKKAQELGIPPGPLYTKLQMGQDITLEDGRVVCKIQFLVSPFVFKTRVLFCLLFDQITLK